MDTVNDIVFVDTDKIFSCSVDGSIKLWDKHEGKFILSLEVKKINIIKDFNIPYPPIKCYFIYIIYYILYRNIVEVWSVWLISRQTEFWLVEEVIIILLFGSLYLLGGLWDFYRVMTQQYLAFSFYPLKF